MAHLASTSFTLIAALAIAVVPTMALAGDLFTGFQMDDDGQYFAYLGLRETLPWEVSELKTYVQLFASGQSYEYESGNRDIEAEIQSLTPSLGVTKSLTGTAWSLSALAGPQLRWKKEEGFLNDSGRDLDVGVFVQAESMYWKEAGSLHAIVSYASLDDFFFGRLRGKMRAFTPETGCCQVFLGFEAAGMGNDDFRALQIGPLVEVPVGRVFLLARGGYQNDNSSGSRGYGGLELYMPF